MLPEEAFESALRRAGTGYALAKGKRPRISTGSFKPHFSLLHLKEAIERYVHFFEFGPVELWINEDGEERTGSVSELLQADFLITKWPLAP